MRALEMIIYTIGFTKKSAEDFFENIINEEIEVLIDTRLNNQSQLAGFSKGRDLPYFLRKLANCEYIHEINYAPTKDILSDYKKGNMSWDDYEFKYNKLIQTRGMVDNFIKNYCGYSKVVILCSEHTPEHCHRRLLVDEIVKRIECKVVHL
ncbi:DUF488 domain-containing protein [Streptococcus australis]|uniref:DUF488 domain-containing protein n=1 Tax=Streptococcus australis TaxID=113107 RepID=UPI0039C4107E